MAENETMLKLSEIDPTVIRNTNLRFKIEEERLNTLRKTIEEDSQRDPITVRKLTEEELKSATDGAIYGIIDGHGRYMVAQEAGRDEILACIEPYTDDKTDITLAARLNFAHAELKPIEKGKILYMLIRELGEKPTKEKVGEIGDSVFGLAVSSSYRYLRMWKLSEEGQKQVIADGGKPAKEAVSEALDFSTEALEYSWNGISYDSDIHTYRDCVFQVDAIIDLEKRLKAYKDSLKKRLEDWPQDEEGLDEWKKAKKKWDDVRSEIDKLEAQAEKDSKSVDFERLSNLYDEESTLWDSIGVPRRKDAIQVIKDYDVKPASETLTF